MTAIALDQTAAPGRSRSLGERVLAVVRLHFVNPTAILWLPLMILGIIFAANWVLWWLIHEFSGGEDIAEGTQWSGASAFIFVYMMVVAIQAMHLTFQYALGMGATRRDYYLGSALTFVLLGAGWAVLIGTLGVLEELTGGWGLNGRMFTSVYFGTDGAAVRYWYVFLLFLLFLFLGALSGALFVRWKGLGVTALWVGLGLLLVAGLAVVIMTNAWGAIGDFLGTIGTGGAYALTLIGSALAGIGGFLVLRRATPRT